MEKRHCNNNTRVDKRQHHLVKKRHKRGQNKRTYPVRFIDNVWGPSQRGGTCGVWSCGVDDYDSDVVVDCWLLLLLVVRSDRAVFVCWGELW